jgi:hypothetical protein
MDPTARSSANSTAQGAGIQPINLHHDLFRTDLHRDHPVSFQMQQFPDKSFQQHLVSTSSASFWVKQRKVADSRCPFERLDRNLLDFQSLNLFTLLGEEPFLISPC